MIGHLISRIKAFREDRSGTACLEFAIALPLLLLIVAIIVEGTRITWTHQAAASGVRDASRYLARIAPDNICITGAPAIADFNADVLSIVTARMGTPAERILPNRVNIVDVSPQLQRMNVSYSTEDVCVVSVSATLEIEFPFAGAFDLLFDRLEPLTTVITDESRIYGV